MASPGNRHCANCIGALSFPIASRIVWYRIVALTPPRLRSTHRLQNISQAGFESSQSRREGIEEALGWLGAAVVARSLFVRTVARSCPRFHDRNKVLYLKTIDCTRHLPSPRTSATSVGGVA